MTESFVSGLLVAGYLVIGLFFLRFWRDSADRLFAWFALAFWMLAAQRAGLVMVSGHPTEETLLYGLRALAFLVIIWAILDKNRRPG